MFAYTLEAALKSKSLDRLVVSSDDLELRPLAERYGVEFMERPQELATDTASLEDSIRQVCRFLQSTDGFIPDLAVMMQGNVPVRKEGQIDEVIARFQELPHATAVCTAQELRHRPEWAKVLKNDGQARPFLSGPFGYRTQDFQELFLLDGAVCGVRRETLFSNKQQKTAHAWLGESLYLILQDHPMYSLEVDYPDQVSLAEFYLFCEEYGFARMREFMESFTKEDKVTLP